MYSHVGPSSKLSRRKGCLKKRNVKPGESSKCGRKGLSVAGPGCASLSLPGGRPPEKSNVPEPPCGAREWSALARFAFLIGRMENKPRHERALAVGRHAHLKFELFRRPIRARLFFVGSLPMRSVHSPALLRSRVYVSRERRSLLCV